MTDQELRALDAEVHQRVMGGSVRYPASGTSLAHTVVFPAPPYSTDIEAAWLVMEEMGRRAPALTFLNRFPDGSWGCRFGGTVHPRSGTAPLAICRAALKWFAERDESAVDGGRDSDSYKLNPGGARA